jgi:hypothetical protein
VVSVLTVEGFEELNKKIKQLDDKVKREEVLKIQRRLAKPLIAAYSRALPVGGKKHSRTTFNKKTQENVTTTYEPGNLRDSVKADTVPASKVGGNPAIAIRPSKKAGADGYYRFMVVKKGTKLGSNRRGSRKGKNSVTEEARNKALASKGLAAQKEAGDKTAKYIQRRINTLSK